MINDLILSKSFRWNWIRPFSDGYDKASSKSKNVLTTEKEKSEIWSSIHLYPEVWFVQVFKVLIHVFLLSERSTPKITKPLISSIWRGQFLGNCTLTELPLHRGQCPGIPAAPELQSSTPFTLNCIIRIHRTPPLLTGERNLSPVQTVMRQEQPMLIETLVAECRLDHSGSFVHGMASVW